MPRFPEKWLDELKSKIDIVAVLGKFMYLQRKGNKFWACCPFHNEKTASFCVNSDDQYYHCFGCGKSGNAITFLTEHERMSYAEAIEYLAKEYNMEIPESDDPDYIERRVKKEKLIAANKAAARYYYANLSKPEASGAIAYMDNRNLRPDIRVTFGMGYAIDGYGLYRELSSQGFAKQTLINAGLINEDGYDPLAKRLIIPIINAKGQVIGFGGRTLIKDVKPKYRNTKGTPLFDKRKNLYNINLFKRTLPEDKHVSIILTEGYMDVISLYQAGIHNVVASMGTSLTIEQCNEIRKYVSKVYVCYDGDTAGQMATWRSLDMLASVGLDVKVMSMPQGLDPDDCINKYGVDGFRKLMDRALPLTEFKIRTLQNQTDTTTLEGKEKFALSTIPVLASLEPVSRDVYTKLVSELSGLSIDSLNTQVMKYLRGETLLKPQQPEKKENKNSSAYIRMCRFVLASMVELKDYVYAKDLNEGIFEDEIHKKVYRYLVSRMESKVPPRKGDLYDIELEYKCEIDEILDSLYQIPLDKQADHYNACMEKLLQGAKQNRINTLFEEIKTAPPEKQEELKSELRKLLYNK